MTNEAKLKMLCKKNNIILEKTKTGFLLSKKDLKLAYDGEKNDHEYVAKFAISDIKTGTWGSGSGV